MYLQILTNCGHPKSYPAYSLTLAHLVPAESGALPAVFMGVIWHTTFVVKLYPRYSLAKDVVWLLHWLKYPGLADATVAGFVPGPNARMLTGTLYRNDTKYVYLIHIGCCYYIFVHLNTVQYSGFCYN